MLATNGFSLLLLLPLIAFGQVQPSKGMLSDAYFKGKTNNEISAFCKSGQGGTQDIDYCAKRDFEKADKQLGITYKRTYRVVSESDKNSGESQFPMLPMFAKAQKAWVEFRDAECEFVYRSALTGSMRNQEYFSCMESMTKARIAKLAKTTAASE